MNGSAGGARGTNKKAEEKPEEAGNDGQSYQKEKTRLRRGGSEPKIDWVNS